MPVTSDPHGPIAIKKDVVQTTMFSRNYTDVDDVEFTIIARCNKPPITDGCKPILLVGIWCCNDAGEYENSDYWCEFDFAPQLYPHPIQEWNGLKDKRYVYEITDVQGENTLNIVFNRIKRCIVVRHNGKGYSYAFRVPVHKFKLVYSYMNAEVDMMVLTPEMPIHTV